MLRFRQPERKPKQDRERAMTHNSQAGLVHHRLFHRIRPRIVENPARTPAIASSSPPATRRKSPISSPTYPETGLALALDVDEPAQIAAAVEAAMKKFGRIDVLVNNAGYGYLAAVEEGEDAEIRAMFETNVFGLAAMCRAVLPILRAQTSGTIVNISSMGGVCGFPGHRLLQCDQIRGRRPVRSHGQGTGAAGRQGPDRRARPVPNRLGGALPENAEKRHRRLCGDGHRAAQGDPGL